VTGFKQKGDGRKMLKNNEKETKESGKMTALTLALTKFLLLAVIVAAFWLAQMILNENNQLNEITRRIILQ
jgi:hypothetical protein